MRSTLLLVLVLIPTARGDWPQYRGPNRDGHAPDAKLPSTWPVKPPAPLWKQKVGEGQGGPAITGGQVFVLGRADGKETCFALYAKTGKVRWKHSVATDYKAPDPRAGDGPRSTPCVDGDRVYMVGVAGPFYCFSLSGKRLWERDLHRDFWGVEKTRDGDDAYATPCGAAACPLADGKQVIFPVGGKKAGAMTAFSRDKGEVLWRSPLKDRSSYASPILATVGGTRQIIAFTGLRMAGFTPTGGKMLWGHPFKQLYDQTILTPIVHRDLVIFGGRDEDLIALRVTNSEGRWKATPAWTNDRLQAYTTTPVVFGDYLAGLNTGGDLVCVGLKDGATAWTQRGLSDYHGSLVVAGNQVLLLTSRGELLVFEASGKKYIQKARWKLTTNTPAWGHLAVDGSYLYVRDKTDVLCFDLGR